MIELGHVNLKLVIQKAYNFELNTFKVCFAIILPMCSFILMFFVQYSYPNDVQGKLFGILVLGTLAGGASLPIISRIKSDFEMGWKLYQKVYIGLFVVYLCLTVSSVLLALNKEMLAFFILMRKKQTAVRQFEKKQPPIASFSRT